MEKNNQNFSNTDRELDHQEKETAINFLYFLAFFSLSFLLPLYLAYRNVYSNEVVGMVVSWAFISLSAFVILKKRANYKVFSKVLSLFWVLSLIWVFFLMSFYRCC